MYLAVLPVVGALFPNGWGLEVLLVVSAPQVLQDFWPKTLNAMQQCWNNYEKTNKKLCMQDFSNSLSIKSLQNLLLDATTQDAVQEYAFRVLLRKITTAENISVIDQKDILMIALGLIHEDVFPFDGSAEYNQNGLEHTEVVTQISEILFSIFPSLKKNSASFTERSVGEPEEDSSQVGRGKAILQRLLKKKIDKTTLDLLVQECKRIREKSHITAWETLLNVYHLFPNEKNSEPKKMLKEIMLSLIKEELSPENTIKKEDFKTLLRILTYLKVGPCKVVQSIFAAIFRDFSAVGWQITEEEIRLLIGLYKYLYSAGEISVACEEMKNMAPAFEKMVQDLLNKMQKQFGAQSEKNPREKKVVLNALRWLLTWVKNIKPAAGKRVTAAQTSYAFRPPIA